MPTFKNNTGDYRYPKEIIPINNCRKVKGADNKLNLKNLSLIRYIYLWLKIIRKKSPRQVLMVKKLFKLQ